jgi:hypothetical protein
MSWSSLTPPSTVHYNPACWLAKHGRFEGDNMPPCDGRLVKVHLIPQQVLKRECPGVDVWDPVFWVLGCGGPTGIGGHHGALDSSKRLRIPRRHIPAELEEVAKQLKITWWLEEHYVRRARPHRSASRGAMPEDLR